MEPLGTGAIRTLTVPDAGGERAELHQLLETLHCPKSEPLLMEFG